MEITSVKDVAELATNGFADWKSLGEVNVSENGDLLLFSYTNAAQYEGRWNAFEIMSRGLIINRKTGEIVARPFDKFFNWGEGDRSTEAALVRVTEKMDGSLGILYRDAGVFKIATRGSFTSDQAQWATRKLQGYGRLGLLDIEDKWTCLFEIIYPDNRIVVDYGDAESLVLLAARDRFTGEYATPHVVQAIREACDFESPGVSILSSPAELLEATSRLPASSEGWVAEFADGQRFKFKGDEYKRLHKLLTGISFKWTLENIAAGTLDDAKQLIPEEFHGDIDGWELEIRRRFMDLRETIEAFYAAAPKDDRKTFAEYAKRLPVAKFLFARLDGKDYGPMIFRTQFKNKSIGGTN